MWMRILKSLSSRNLRGKTICVPGLESSPLLEASEIHWTAMIGSFGEGFSSSGAARAG